MKKKGRLFHKEKQEDLAKGMKVDPSYISKIEKPGKKLSLKTLEQIADVLHCTVNELA